jgi:ABC-type glycerol-3-phosphate transport system substrate-binding protein
MTQPDNPNLDYLATPKRSVAVRIVLLVVAVGCIGAAVALAFMRGRGTAAGGADGGGATPNTPLVAGPSPVAPSGRVTIGIAYGTEKRTWLEQAAKDFAVTAEGRDIDVNLIPLGSLEAAQKICAKDQTINVWSPASALYKDTFVSQWQGQYGKSPILHEEQLALTPMVFVMWNDRYKPFQQKLGEPTFKSINQAMRIKEGDKTGWAAIAGQPDWMFFKFSHTHPQKSNSGLMTLVLMAYDYFGKTDGLTGADLTRADFQDFFESTETGVVAPIGTLVDSTGNLMDDMVRKGPSTYDAIFVYESVAIDRLRNAEGRWKDSLRVVYPKFNMWNDNPYYILDVPWSTPEQRKAAAAFLAYLTSPEVQAKAMDHGFRPANMSVPTNTADSPFVKYKDYGLKLDLGGGMCAPPKNDVIEGLLNRWQVVRGSR